MIEYIEDLIFGAKCNKTRRKKTGQPFYVTDGIRIDHMDADITLGKFYLEFSHRSLGPKGAAFFRARGEDEIIFDRGMDWDCEMCRFMEFLFRVSERVRDSMAVENKILGSETAKTAYVVESDPWRDCRRDPPCTYFKPLPGWSGRCYSRGASDHMKGRKNLSKKEILEDMEKTVGVCPWRRTEKPNRKRTKK